MSTTSVLYDAPGPRARRRARIFSVIALLVLLAGAALVVRKLADQDEFSSALWGPLINPSDPAFHLVWQRIGKGLGATAVAAVLAIAFSVVIGTAIGVVRMTAGPRARIPVVALIELLRGLPVLIQIYFVYLCFPDIGINVGPLPGPDGLWYLVIGLTTYNSVILAETLRAGVAALPRGQREAGIGIGLSPLQTMRIILLPQAFRTMLPALISQVVVILKDTSLAGTLALYFELLRQGISIQQVLQNPIQMFLVIGAIYVLVNLTLSRLAVAVQQGRRRKGPVSAPVSPQVVQEQPA